MWVQERTHKASYHLLALPCQRIVSKLPSSNSKAWLVKTPPKQIYNISNLLIMPGFPWPPVVFGKCLHSCCIMIILLIWRKDNLCISWSTVAVILISLFRSCAKQKVRTAISSSKTVPSKTDTVGNGHYSSWKYFRTNCLSNKFIVEQVLVHSEIKIVYTCKVSTLQFGSQWLKYVSQ